MIGKISDYNARDEVAGVIGAKCAETESVVNSSAAPNGPRPGLQAVGDALVTCEAESFEGGWSAPSKSSSEAVRRMGHTRRRARGAKEGRFPHLSVAAVAAPTTGPTTPSWRTWPIPSTPPWVKSRAPIPKHCRLHWSRWPPSGPRDARVGWPACRCRLRSPGSKPAGHDLRSSKMGGFLYAAASVKQDLPGREEGHCPSLRGRRFGQRFDILTRSQHFRRPRLRSARSTPSRGQWVSDTLIARGAEDAAARLIQD